MKNCFRSEYATPFIVGLCLSILLFTATEQIVQHRHNVVKYFQNTHTQIDLNTDIVRHKRHRKENTQIDMNTDKDILHVRVDGSKCTPCDKLNQRSKGLESFLTPAIVFRDMTWVFIINEADSLGHSLSSNIMSTLNNLEATLIIPIDPLVSPIGQLPYFPGFDQKGALLNKIPNTGPWRHRAISRVKMLCVAYNYYLALLEDDWKVDLTKITTIGFIEKINIRVSSSKFVLAKEQQKGAESDSPTRNRVLKENRFALDTLVDVFPCGKFIVLYDESQKQAQASKRNAEVDFVKLRLRKLEVLSLAIPDKLHEENPSGTSSSQREYELVQKVLRFLG